AVGDEPPAPHRGDRYDGVPTPYYWWVSDGGSRDRAGGPAKPGAGHAKRRATCPGRAVMHRVPGPGTVPRGTMSTRRGAADCRGGRCGGVSGTGRRRPTRARPAARHGTRTLAALAALALGAATAVPPAIAADRRSSLTPHDRPVRTRPAGAFALARADQIRARE